MDFSVRSVGHRRISDDDSVILTRERLVSANYADRRLEKFSAEECYFERCRFDGTVIELASFGAGSGTSEYVGCSFDGATLRMASGGYARFTDCSFEGATIEGWFCRAVELVGCAFSGRLKKVVFNGAVPEEERPDVGRSVNRFEGNDFSRAKLTDVGFRTGIDLTKQTLPPGPEYIFLDDAPEAVRRARAAFDTWTDPEAKKRANGVLMVMEEDVADGQMQLLMRVEDYPRAARPAIQRLMEAARGT